MRILMLGNSFTYFHDMPAMLSALTGAEVVSRTRGGARLGQQLDPEDELGQGSLRALATEAWDFVVLQEASFVPIGAPEFFQTSVSRLCEMAKTAGATPLLYATWAYQEGSDKLAKTGLSYIDMAAALRAAYHEAAEANGAQVADVGDAFTAVRGLVNLYDPDGYHPSEAGSLLAAATLVRAIDSCARSAP